MAPPVALLAYAPTTPRAPRSGRSPCSARSGRRSRYGARAGDPGAVLRPARRRARPRRGRRTSTAEPARSDPAWPDRWPRPAGYDDPERWWDDVVESRRRRPHPFEAIAEAMAALREDDQSRPRGHEARREALHAPVLRRDAARTASSASPSSAAPGTCPALADPLPPASHDQTRPQRTAEARRSRAPGCRGRTAGSPPASGYGAGIASPGWYHHLFTAAGRRHRALADRRRRACCARRTCRSPPRT